MAYDHDVNRLNISYSAVTVDPPPQVANTIQEYNNAWAQSQQAYAGLQQSAQSSVQGLGQWVGQLNSYGSLGSLGACQQMGNWVPASTAAGDFLKIQYAQTEVKCAITKKKVPAGSPIMLIGGVVISQEAFEDWLERTLCASLIPQVETMHEISGYDE